MNQHSNMGSGAGSDMQARYPEDMSHLEGRGSRAHYAAPAPCQGPSGASYHLGYSARADLRGGFPPQEGSRQDGAGGPFAEPTERHAQPEPGRGRKILDRVISVLTTVIFVVALLFTLVVVATTLSSRGGEATFFGWKPYIVLSDSMQTEFQVGDIAVSRAVDVSTLDEGDIITFESIDPDNYGEVYTHKIRERTTYEGQPAFTTYGTTTGDDDLYPALESKVVGEYVFAIPKAGYAFDFFKSPAGYVVLVLIPFSILIGLQIRNIVRLVKEGRADQSAALAAEQQRVREMQEEIDRLRAGAEVPSRGPALRAPSGGAPFAGAGARNPASGVAPARGVNDPRAARRAAMPSGVRAERVSDVARSVDGAHGAQVPRRAHDPRLAGGSHAAQTQQIGASAVTSDGLAGGSRVAQTQPRQATGSRAEFERAGRPAHGAPADARRAGGGPADARRAGGATAGARRAGGALADEPYAGGATAGAPYTGGTTASEGVSSRRASRGRHARP